MVKVLYIIYENRRMKTVEFVLILRGRGRRERTISLLTKGVKSLSKMYSKPMCKYHNVSSCTIIIC
jgi:hypothetical protein